MNEPAMEYYVWKETRQIKKLLQKMDKETELHAEIDVMAKLCMLLKQDLAEKDAEIERLKALLSRAAEMLETLGCKGPAVAELRKAAE